MTGFRQGRRKYYDRFAPYYDAFIRFHARSERSATRRDLVSAAAASLPSRPRVLDVCCGTGDVILAFAADYPRGVLVGCDFSHNMLLQAAAKAGGRVSFFEGDASRLPFSNDRFHVVSCSHALYELKRPARERALAEMRRVVRSDGVVLLMEHEVPGNRLVRALFYLRILSMGSADAREFIGQGLDPFRRVFRTVELRHSRSGRSKLIICRK